MPSFDTVDSLVIPAPAERLFAIILDYPRMHEWYPPYRVEVEGGGEVAVGARLNHVLSPAGSPVKSRFVRTIRKIDAPRAIEETYDGGDLIGQGRWEFEPLGPEETKVSFVCSVRSNSLLMHIGFLLGGEKGHNQVYQEILAALKAKAGGASTGSAPAPR